MWGGYQGPGAKTVIGNQAGAKVSMRLVPDQDPERLFRSFADTMRSLAPPGIEVEVEKPQRGAAGACRPRRPACRRGP